MKLIFRRAIRFADPTPELDAPEIPLPDQLIIPLRQHAGSPAEAVVGQGDEVAEGQLLGRAGSESGEAAPVHAPAAGRVVDLASKNTLRGNLEPCVILEPSGPPEETPQELPDEIPELDQTAALTRIQEAGVVAAGFNNRPLADELSPTPPQSQPSPSSAPQNRPVANLILAGVDREPGLFVHRRLARWPHPLLFQGLKTIRSLLGAEKTTLVGDKHLHRAAFEEVLAGPGTDVVILDNAAFPAGLKHVLVQRITRREIPLPHGRARDVGVAFVRLETAYWTGLAVAWAKPHTAKWLTITAPQSPPRLIKALLGTPVKHILDSLGIRVQEKGKLILGGRLTGQAVHDLNTPVTKEVDGVVVLSPDQVRHFSQEPCFHCGLCFRVCPSRLLPGELSKYCEHARFEEAEQHHLFHCIECGLCAYVCPAKRPMVHFFRHAKEELMARRAAQ